MTNRILIDGTTSASFYLGTASGNRKIFVETNDGSPCPYIGYEPTLGKWSLSNDGVVEREILCVDGPGDSSNARDRTLLADSFPGQTWVILTHSISLEIPSSSCNYLFVRILGTDDTGEAIVLEAKLVVNRPVGPLTIPVSDVSVLASDYGVLFEAYAEGTNLALRVSGHPTKSVRWVARVEITTTPGAI
jgi:hypothetical protein